MILVDTPGLYSRMNFGYDVLTREFRDSAACAVFVVKTDNLFLEQVFAEFNQLLGIFSRIFIVVNVDTSKRDLAPDGSLRPSAESENPERVLEAFRTLSMAGPLRAAYDAGHVRIHAVDLMGAASVILSGTVANGAHLPEFDAFQNDLMEYLNSSDYTREFIRDSVRQARTLCGEMQRAVEGGEVTALRARQDALGAEICALDQKIAATDRLLQTDLAAYFQPLHEEHRHGAEEAATSKTAQLREEIRQGFTRWMAGSDSLTALPHLHWNPSLTDAARTLAEENRARLERLAGTPHAGLQLPPERAADLQTAEFSPRVCGRNALTATRADDEVATYKMTLRTETLPVKKNFADWLFFRSRAKVRQRVFGADGNREITPLEKQRRLGPESLVEFERQWQEAVRERFPARPVASATKLAATYAAGATENIRSALRPLRASLCAQREARQTPYDFNAAILRATDDLHQQAARVTQDLDLLSDKEAVVPVTPPPFPQTPPPIPQEFAHASDPGLIPSAAIAMFPLLAP